MAGSKHISPLRAETGLPSGMKMDQPRPEAGAAAGLVLAAAFTRLLTNMLYGVSLRDVATLTGVAAMVFGVSVAASLLPALRATRLEPMKVLREE
jgi:ABC-type lipoprotein release transport system permease subunit